MGICNTEEMATIQVRRNCGSGKYFICFIEHTGTYVSGYWQDRQITEEQYKTLMEFCAPTYTKEEKDKKEIDYAYMMAKEYAINHGRRALTREEFECLWRMTFNEN